MTTTITIEELQERAEELISHLSANNEILVERAGKTVARITRVPAPASASTHARPLGRWKGQVWMSPDFNDDLSPTFWFPPNDPLMT